MTTLKTLFGSEQTITLTAASLASDAGLIAGRASTVVDNGTNLYLDALVSGKITTGTSPTVSKTIELWAYGAYNDTPTYIDGITGSDANKSITSLNVKFSGLRLLWSAVVDATSDRAYFIPPTSIAARFGVMPKRWGLFLVHDTAVALNSTGGNHEFKYIGIHGSSV
jgi:hypothetical protein